MIAIFVLWLLFKIFPSICSLLRSDLPSQKKVHNVTSDNAPTPIGDIGGGRIITHGMFPVPFAGINGVRIDGKITLIMSSLPVLEDSAGSNDPDYFFGRHPTSRLD